jgi:hypothetical protein
VLRRKVCDDDALFPRFSEMEVPRLQALHEHSPFFQLSAVLGEDAYCLRRQQTIDIDRDRRQRAFGDQTAQIADQFLSPLNCKG